MIPNLAVSNQYLYGKKGVFSLQQYALKNRFVYRFGRPHFLRLYRVFQSVSPPHCRQESERKKEGRAMNIKLVFVVKNSSKGSVFSLGITVYLAYQTVIAIQLNIAIAINTFRVNRSQKLCTFMFAFISPVAGSCTKYTTQS